MLQSRSGKNRPEVFVAILLATALTSGTVSATGMLECDTTDQSQWQAQSNLEDQLVSEGWSVRKIKIDGNCYEVYGTTPEGDKVEAYFNPVSFEKLLVSRRGMTLFRKDKILYQKGE